MGGCSFFTRIILVGILAFAGGVGCQFYERNVPGYPSLIVGIMVIGGVQLLMIGVMGEYIGKILSEIKARPVYFVAEHSVKAAEEDSARNAAE